MGAPHDRLVERWGVVMGWQLRERKIKLTIFTFFIIGAWILGFTYRYCFNGPDLQTGGTIIAGWLTAGALTYYAAQ